jgi:predicted dehydrogenase
MALRIAVCGVGERGRQWAAQIQASPRWDLVACADSDPEALAAAGDLGVPDDRLFPSLPGALDATPCDVVVTATPSALHEEPARQTIERGIAALVEKPFTHRLAGARALVELAESKRVPLVIGQNLRYTRAHRTVRRLMAEDAIGRVRMMTCHAYRLPEFRPRQSSEPRNALWDLAVHHFDAFRHTLGELSGVMAHTFADEGAPPDASVHALLAFESGARGTYSASYESSGHQYFGNGQEFYERITGERATLHVTHRWLTIAEGRRVRRVPRGKRTETEEAVLLGQVERALATGETPDASGRDNLGTVAVLEACARSAEQGRWVDPREVLAGG